MQIDDTRKSQMVFGITVDGWRPDSSLAVGDAARGYPRASVKDTAAGRVYGSGRSQHLRDFFIAPTARPIKLAPDRGEGQHWNLCPGQSAVETTQGPHRLGARPIEVVMDDVDPPDPAPSLTPNTCATSASRLLSFTKFWGLPIYLSAVVLVPEGFDSHPEARYPLIISFTITSHPASMISVKRIARPEPPNRITPSASILLGTTAFNRRRHTRTINPWIAPEHPSHADCRSFSTQILFTTTPTP